MPFPADPIDLEVGFQLDETWVNADSADGVRAAQPVTITRGKANWSSRADTGRASMILDNNSGVWSPDNQSGTHFTDFRRNVPMRVGVGLDDVHIASNGVDNQLCSTPDAAALDITGDIDIRVEFQFDHDIVGGLQDARYRSADMVNKGSSYRLFIEANANQQLYGWLSWSAGDFFSDEDSIFLPVNFQHDRAAVRVTLDVDNGASGRTATWYTSDAIDGTWTEIGSQTDAGVTSITPNATQLEIGERTTAGDASGVPFPGKVYALEIRDGIDGTVVADPDFTAQTVGATSFDDAAGNTWTVNSGGEITNQIWRFQGEVASIPVRWDKAGKDTVTPIEASGLFRRLRQGNRQLESAIRRFTTRSGPASGLIQYWPCEEVGEAVSSMAAAVGTAPLVITAGNPSTAAVSNFVASKPLPTPGDSVWTATVDPYTDLEDWEVRWHQFIPSGFTGTDVTFMTVVTSDMTWTVEYRDANGGDLRLIAVRGASTIYNSGYVSFNATGEAFRMVLTIETNGTDFDLSLTAQEKDGVASGVAVTAHAAGEPGQVTSMVVNADGEADSWGLGHVALYNEPRGSAWTDLELDGYEGETAAQRIIRLCVEEGLEARIEGDSTVSEAMGPQPADTIMALFEECAATDLGILHEARSARAVGYRTRASMVGQTGIALDYAVGEVAAPLEPDRDDQNFFNDIIVTNYTGSTGSAVLDSAEPISISEPPLGVGRYQTSFTVNAELDSRLDEIARSYLQLNAVDEARISRLVLGLHHSALVADAALTRSILLASLGDVYEVSNPHTEWNDGDAVRLLVQGIKERISNYEYTISALTSPAQPYDRGFYVTWGTDDDLFFDDFGTTVDTYDNGVLGSEWEAFDGTGNAGNGLRATTQVDVITSTVDPDSGTEGSDGYSLRIQAAWNGVNIRSGIVQNTDEEWMMQYGRYRWRQRSTVDSTDQMSSVSLLWNHDDALPYHEVDAVETIDVRTTNDPIASFIHRPNPVTEVDEQIGPFDWEPPNVQYSVDLTRWHTFQLTWLPWLIQMEVDDTLVWVLTRDRSYIPHRRMKWSFQLDAWSNLTLGGNTVELEAGWIQIEKALMT